MILRDEVEKLLAATRRRREELEAEAQHAAEDLVRLASGLTPLAEVDTDRLRAAADDYAAAMDKLKMLDDFARQLRGLLI